MKASDNQRVYSKRRGRVASRHSSAGPMIERFILFTIVAASVWGASDGTPLRAQTNPPLGPSGPDVRGSNPVMMLVVDTSGSMEYRPKCECTSDTCIECYPQCGGDLAYRKNRWAITLEALTGSWVNDFDCQQFARSDSSVFDYDFGYPIPYHQPWQCPAGTSEPCNEAENRPQREDGILDVYRSRVRFGMMTFDSKDTYLGASSSMLTEKQFNDTLSQSAAGLFSYGPSDAILTYDGDQPLADALGNWVYLTSSDRFRGSNAPDRFVGHLNFPTCTNPYRIDTGVRRGAQSGETIVGGLISPLTPGSEPETINNRIQESLLGARPYLGTPIAASLDDLYFYLKRDTDIIDDSRYECRGRYALLITDGEPDDDFREISNCDCESAEACCNVATNYNPSCTDPLFNATYDPDAKGYQCPYPKAEEVAEALICGYDTSTCSGGALEQLFVVGFALPNCQKVDGEVVCEPGSEGEKIFNRLQAIAEAGSPDGEGKALFADDLDELSVTLAQVLDNISDEPISRTMPAIANSSRGSGLEAVQYQFSSGFIVGSAEQGLAWSGKLERRRIVAADTPLGYIEEDLQSEDRFQNVLNDRNASRKLYTVLPKQGSQCPDTVDPSSECTLNDHLYRGSISAPCGDIDCDWGSTCDCEIDDNSECGPNPAVPANFADCPLTATQLGADAGDDERRAQLIRWLHGVAELSDPVWVQQRKHHRLGDIVFSSPAVIGSPDFARDDDSFNQFRQASIVAHRPLVLYVGSNDGILHAFSVEEYPGSEYEPPAPYDQTSLTTGEEIWGFIPPAVVGFVDDRANEWKAMVDGTPVVKDVFLARRPGQGLCLDPDKSPPAPDDDGLCNYRTILIVGLRDGGSAYIALDVTNPMQPKFLWQFAHPDLGRTYGKAGLGQVTMEWPPGETDRELMERAVAILPGGKNSLGPAEDPPGTLLSCPSLKQPGGMNRVYQTRSEPDSTSIMHDHRDNVRCWQPDQYGNNTGRSVFIVDVKTGILIKEIDSSIFPSPVIGSPSLFHGEVGTIATRAFVADADGVLWRIDLSDTDPQPDSQLEGWTARPFHDMYWAHTTSNGYEHGYADGEPGYEPPVLSVDEKGRVVVIYGTGDIDNFEDETARNYVVSLTETNAYGSGTEINPDEVQAAFNWEIARGSESGGSSRGMGIRELVTGPIELFDGKVFFSSFQPATVPGDCIMGRGHLFAVDYVKRDTNFPNPDHSPTTYYPLELTAEQLGGDAENFNRYHDNYLFMGAAVVKRPQFHTVVDDSDPYAEFGGLVSTVETTPPVFELMGMATGGTRTGGSDLGTSALRLPAPVSVSRALSMSTSCE